MTTRAPSAITLRIRAMARIERLKDKLTQARKREAQRALMAREKLTEMEEELKTLEAETKS